MNARVGAEQLIFTSCRFAIGGGSGFQVKSQSSGIATEDVAAIAQRSDYLRPTGPAGSPSGAGGAGYPIALRWYTLPSGHQALTRAVYVGADYSGRTGNFFAHTLVFPRADLERIDPMAWFSWEGWRESLRPDEDDAPPAAPLPRVEWVQAPRRPIPTSLLRAAGARARIERLLLGLFDATDRKQALVLRATAHVNTDWLLLLSHCLPRGMIAATEFSTFESSLRRAPALTVCVDGTDIDFASGERGGLFVGVDLMADAGPTERPAGGLTEAGRAYAHVVATLLFEHPALLATFQEHVDAFGGAEPNADLASVAEIFLLTATATAPRAGRVQELVRFALKSRADPDFARLVEGMIDQLQVAASMGAIEDRVLLVEALTFVMQGSPQSADAHARQAADAFLTLFLAALPSWESWSAVVEAAHRRLEALIGRRLYQLHLDAVRADDGAGLQAAMAASGPAGACEAVWFLIELLDDLGEPDPAGAVEVEKLIQGLMGGGGPVAERLLAVVIEGRDVAQKATLIGMAGADEDDALSDSRLTVLGEVMAALTDALSPHDAVALRAQVPGYLVAAEWRARLSGTDVAGSYKRFAPVFLTSAAGGREAAETWPLRRYAALAAERDETPEALLLIIEDMIRAGTLESQPEDDQVRWIRRLGETVPIGGGTTSREHAALVLTQGKRLGLAFTPDRAALCRDLEVAASGKPLLPDRAASIDQDFDRLTKEEQVLLSSRLLHSAFRNPSHDGGGHLHEALMSGPLSRIGRDARSYGLALGRLAEDGDHEALARVLAWWFSQPRVGGRAADEVWKAIFGDLAQAAIAADAAHKPRPIEAMFIEHDRGGWTFPERHEQWCAEYRRRRGRSLGGALSAFGRMVGGALARTPPVKD
jgi:hypothetical protein